ncbi:hypothetical protein JCM16358_26360 [Halanaerocella petrolearia]
MKWQRLSVLLISCLLVAVITGQVIAESKFKPQWKEVVDSSQQLITQNQAQLQTKYELAVAYANLGQIKKANKLFDELDQKDWEQKLEKLITDYEKRIDQKEDIQLLNYLAFSYFIDDQYKESEKLFNNIVKLDKNNIWSYNYLAITQHKQEKYNQAQDMLEKSLEITDNEYTHFLLGVNYYKQGNIFKAMYHVAKGKEAADLFLD